MLEAATLGGSLLWNSARPEPKNRGRKRGDFQVLDSEGNNRGDTLSLMETISKQENLKARRKKSRKEAIVRGSLQERSARAPAFRKN